jgi:hypothetical protein
MVRRSKIQTRDQLLIIRSYTFNLVEKRYVALTLVLLVTVLVIDSYLGT